MGTVEAGLLTWFLFRLKANFATASFGYLLLLVIHSLSGEFLSSATFHKDKYAVTLDGGMMNNPGRYLTLLPPIDGATAVTGSPYFTENPGDKAHMWDSTVNLQWMPREYITWWVETGYRHSDVPYFSGRGGITPPGGNNSAPQYYTCNTGAFGRHKRLGVRLHRLRGAWQRLVPGSAAKPGQPQRGRDGQVLSIGSPKWNREDACART